MIGPAADDFRDSPATDSNPHDSQGSTTRTKAFNNRFLRKKALLRRMNEPSWQARRQHRDNPRADEPGAENREAHSRNPQAIAAGSARRNFGQPAGLADAPGRKIGRAHVCTPVTNAQLVS